jgi:hypothetical protein
MEYSAVRVIFTIAFPESIESSRILWQTGRYPQTGAKWAF